MQNPVLEEHPTLPSAPSDAMSYTCAHYYCRSPSHSVQPAGPGARTAMRLLIHPRDVARMQSKSEVCIAGDGSHGCSLPVEHRRLFMRLGGVETDFRVCLQTQVSGATTCSLPALAPEQVSLFSSTSAVWSQAGAAHYAAGNAFLDATAATAVAAGLPTAAVNFGLFRWALIRSFQTSATRDAVGHTLHRCDGGSDAGGGSARDCQPQPLILSRSDVHA